MLNDHLHGFGIRPRQCDGWAAFLASQEPVGLTVAPLEQGLWLLDPDLAIVTETQLYGERVRQERRRKARERDGESIVRNLTELTEGAPVVHEDHGVGRYLGLQTLSIGGLTTEFLTLEYAKGDKLYVPVSSLHLISRYTGASPENAPAAPLGRRPVGQGQAQGRREGPRRGRRVAGHLCPARRPRGRRLPRTGTGIRRLRRCLRLRGDPGPVARHRGGAGRHGGPQADGPGGVRRCGLRQDRGRHARRLRGRRRRAPGGGAGAHHPARPAAFRELLRPLRRLADQGREPVALPDRQGAEGDPGRPGQRHPGHRGRHPQAVAADR